MALKEIIGFPTALYYILFRALKFNFSANKFFLENKSMDTSTIFKSNNSFLFWTKEKVSSVSVVRLSSKGQLSVISNDIYVMSVDGFHIGYVCSMMAFISVMFVQ